MFELNSKIELIDDKGEAIFGIIHDYVDDKLYVSTTSHEKNFKLLRANDSVTGAFFVGTKGQSFDGVISDRISGEMLIYEISDIKNIESFQRREDVRVDMSLPVYFSDDDYYLELKKSDLGEQIDTIKSSWKKGTILNLSGGGMKLSVNKRFEANQELLFLFYINDEPIIVKGNLLHKSVNIVGEVVYHNYGVKFADVTESERESIISYIFVVMRKNRIR